MASLNIKTKVKSFFSGLQQKEKGLDYMRQDEGEVHAMQPADLPHAREDLRKTEEVIADIEREYFMVDEDCPKFELERLEDEVTIASLEDRIFTLKTQDNAIYRQIYSLVSDNYHAYVRELENVTMLEESLKDAARTCIGARFQLKLAREGVSHGGLGLLAKHRKRERLRALLDILRTLKTLHRTDNRLKQLLQDGDFPAATQLCLECQNAIETYKHYTCVRELSGTLQDVQSEIEGELETALARMCSNFDQYKYEQIQEAYSILGKTQTAVDTLLMRFTTSIHDSAYAVVADYAKRSPSLSDEESHQQLLKTSYANLCKMVNVDDFIPCLNKICLAMWKVMRTYHQIKLTQEGSDEREATSDGRGGGGGGEADARFNRNYVKTKLENGLLRVWRDVQQKVRPYILGTDMSGFKYDDFIRVLDIVNRLITVGFEFCGEGSTSLQESIRQQSLMYFKNYHRARIDELRIFLEVEAWEVCPVRSSFTIHSLREFRFLQTLSPDSPTKLLSPTRRDGSSVFSRYATDENPFDQQEEEEEEEVIEFGEMDDAVSDDDKGASDGEEDEDGLKDKYGERNTRKFIRQNSSSSGGPLLANTTLTVLRFFGNYIQMMNVLRTIGFDVLECLSQLYDYYLYAIYQFFAKDLMDSSDVQLSSKLTTSLKRITDTLIQDNGMGSVIQTHEGGIKVPSPSVNPVVDLQSSGTLFGLRYRMVAVQSLVFLASQFEYLVTYMEKLIPESNTKNFLSQFLFQTVKTSRELCRPVYYGLASRAINIDQVALMGNVKWDIKEIRSQHSSYVDRLLQEFTSFKKTLSLINKCVSVPSEVSNMLWERAIVQSNRMFVEGFSLTKKCSNEGRALMQLDFQQYRTKLEKMSRIRPLPTHSFVEDYIKAYYLSEEDTEPWIKQHQEYSCKQLQVLVTVGVGSRINKRSRQKLLAVIDELEKSR